MFESANIGYIFQKTEKKIADMSLEALKFSRDRINSLAVRLTD